MFLLFYRPTPACSVWLSTPTGGCQSTRRASLTSTGERGKLRCRPICSPSLTTPIRTCCKVSRLLPFLLTSFELCGSLPWQKDYVKLTFVAALSCKELFMGSEFFSNPSHFPFLTFLTCLIKSGPPRQKTKLQSTGIARGAAADYWYTVRKRPQLFSQMNVRNASKEKLEASESREGGAYGLS